MRYVTVIDAVGGVRQAGLLGDLLEVAVPLEMLHLEQLGSDDRADVMAAWAAQAADLISTSDASLLYRVKAHPATGEPGTAATFAALARGIAAGAFVPGGCTFLGRHWCADHSVCETAAAGRPG